jgi:hypothetical protein
MPKSPKSAQILYAGTLASGKSSTRLIVPARISTFSKSCQDIDFIHKTFSEHNHA